MRHTRTPPLSRLHTNKVKNRYRPAAPIAPKIFERCMKHIFKGGVEIRDYRVSLFEAPTKNVSMTLLKYFYDLRFHQMKKRKVCGWYGYSSNCRVFKNYVPHYMRQLGTSNNGRCVFKQNLQQLPHLLPSFGHPSVGIFSCL